MANKRINYTIGFNVDKQGLNTMKAELREIQNLSAKDLFKTSGISNLNGELDDAKRAASELEAALEKAYNPALGTLNIQKFNEELKKSDGGAEGVRARLEKIGTQGSAAFRNVTMELMTQNKYLKQSSEFLDKMATTMANTVRWSITSGIMNSITASIQQAYGYAKNLDTSLNDIRIVTGKSADEMSRFAIEANKAAKSLGQSTKSYTDASLIYYQQGLSDKEVKARAETTLKAANVTGQSARTVSEQLTAVWNGYKVSAQEAELYVDKLAAVAATTAADLEELSTGMSKVASAASIMGVDIDQLNAQLATIVSVTREAPESIGTALKTVYARMSDIEAGLDAETTLGEYTQQMEAMGIHALDANKQLRDQGEVIEEIGNKWHTLTREQQVSLAQTIAGTRQYSRMMALFDNWDMYTQAMKTSADAAGTLQRQQDIYMESTEAHLQKLSTQMEELYTTLFDTEDINSLVDGLTEIVNGLDAVIKGLGGGAGMLRNLGAIGVNVFSGQIAKGISRVVTNYKAQSEEMQNQIALMEAMDKFGVKANPEEQTDADKKILAQTRKWKENENLMSDEEREASRALLERYNTELKISEALEKEKKQHNEILKVFTEYEDGIVTSTNGTIKILGDENASLEDVSASLKIQIDEWSAIEKNAADALKQIEKVKNAQKDEKAAGQSIGGLKSQISQAEAKRENILQGQNLKFYKKQKQVLLKRQSEDGTFNNAEDAKSLEDIQKIIVKVEELDQKLQTYRQKIADITEEAAKPVEKEFSKLEETVKHVFQDFADKKETIQGSFVPNQDQQKDYDRFIQLYGELSKHAKKANNELKVTDDNINDVSEMLKLFNKLFGESSKKIQETAESFEDLDERSQRSYRNLEAYGNTFDKILEKIDLTKTVEQFVNLGSSILNLGNAVEQFKSLGSIWENEDMTTGEKFIATVSAMTFGLTSSIQAVKGFQEAKKWLTDALNINTVAQAANNKETDKSEKESREAADAVKEHGNAVKKETAAEVADEVTDKFDDVIDGSAKKSGSNFMQKWGQGWKKMGQGIKGGAKDSGKIIKGVGSKIGSGLAKVGPAIGWFALAAAIVGGTWVIVDNVYNKAQKQSKKAEKAAKELSKSYQDNKEKFEEMSSAIDTYDQAQKNLEELTKGTEEYNKALQESNDQVLDLITKYPQLAAGIKTVDGALVLDENTKNQMLAAEQEKLNMSRIASLNASASATEAQTDAAIEQSRKDFNVNPEAAAAKGWAKIGGMVAGIVGTIAAAVGGAFTGGATWAFIPMIAAATAPVITEAIAGGGLDALFEDRITEDKLVTAVEAFNAGVALNDEAALKARGLTEDEIKALQENEAALVQLAQEVKINNEILRAQRLASATERTKVAGYIGDNKDTLDYIFTDDKYQGKIDAEALAEARAMSNAELRQWYSEKYGGELGGFGFLGQGEKATFKTTDASGNIIETQVSKDAIQRLIAAELSKNDDRTATVEISAKIETALNEFSNGNEDQYKLGQQLLAFARKGLVISDLPMKDLKDFDTLINEDLSIFKELFSLMNTSLDDIQTQAYEQKAIFDTKLTELESSLSGKGINIKRNDKFFNDFSMSEVVDVMSMLNDTMESFGEDNQVDDLIEILKSKGVKGSKFLQQFVKLDFAADNIETQIAELADSLYLDLDYSAISTWVDQIQVTNGIFKAADPDKIAEVNRELHNLLWSLRTGATISAEEYKKLIEFKPELADKFNFDSRTGRYVATISDRELNEYLNSEAYFNDRIKDYEKNINNAYTNITSVKDKTQIASNIKHELQRIGINWDVLEGSVITNYEKTKINELIATYNDKIATSTKDKISSFEVDAISLAPYQSILQRLGGAYDPADNGFFGEIVESVTIFFNDFFTGKTISNSDKDLIKEILTDYWQAAGKEESLDSVLELLNYQDWDGTYAHPIYDELWSAIEFFKEGFGFTGSGESQYFKIKDASTLKDFYTKVQTAQAYTNISAAEQEYNDTREAQITAMLDNEIHSASDLKWFNAWLTTSEYTLTTEQQKILDDKLKEIQETADSYREAWEDTVDPFKAINKEIEAQERYLQDLNKQLEKSQDYGEALLINLQAQADANAALLKSEKDRLKIANDFLNDAKNDKDEEISNFLFGDDNILDYATAEEALNAMERKGLIENLNPEGAEYQNYLNWLNSILAVQDQIPEIEASIADREDFELNLYTEHYLAQLDRINSELETQLGYYQKMNDYQRSLIDLAEISGESIAKINSRYDMMTENSRAAVNTAMSALTSADWKELLTDGFQDAADLKAFEQSFTTAFESVLAAIETVNEKYQNAVRTVFGIENNDFKVYEAEWDGIQKRNNEYYDDVNKTYKISEIKSQYIKAINNAPTLEIERKITDAMNDQISHLEDINKLRESDLKIAQARLDVLQAEIALEEAQNSKTNLQLRLGPDGTYSYQYVVDPEAERQKQDELDKARNNEYNIIKDTYMDSVNNVRDIMSEWQEKAAAATSLEELQEINKSYTELYNEALENNADAYKHYTEYAEKYGFEVTDSAWQGYFSDTNRKSGEAVAIALEESFKTMTEDTETLQGYLEQLVGDEGYMTLLSNSLMRLQDPVDEIAKSLHNLKWGSALGSALQSEKEHLNSTNKADITRTLINTSTIEDVDTAIKILIERYPELENTIRTLGEQQKEKLELYNEYKDDYIDYLGTNGIDDETSVKNFVESNSSLSDYERELLSQALLGTGGLNFDIASMLKVPSGNVTYNNSTTENNYHNIFNFYDVDNDEIKDLIMQNTNPDNGV